MHLSTLLHQLLAAPVGARVARGGSAREVTGLREVAQQVQPGEAFVAIRGARIDGHAALPSLGHAALLVVEDPTEAPPGPCVVVVPDTRPALAWVAAILAGFPGRDVPVLGVTGTNGKTSITFLAAAMARAAGWTTGIIGTTGNYRDGTYLPSKYTTPTAPELQVLLADMRGCGLVAMEVSSIGLAAHRADAVPFRAAVYTNLTRDHLDYHGTMEAYAAAKARLFHELCEGRAVLNAGDPSAPSMDPGRDTWWYGPGRDLEAQAVRPCRLPDGRRGTAATLRTPVGTVPSRFPLIGAHNVENVLGALGGALSLGVPLDACVSGLDAFSAVPGRLEAIPTGRGFDLYVDYAHSDDALARVLSTLRALGPGRILTVFGCGGDRDPGKRPIMGRVAGEGSDVVIVTSDNPRSEAPLAIIDAILPGIPAGKPAYVEPDRKAAIALALGLAQAGDLVLVAGKGHEATQTIGGDVLPFDDRAVARALLQDAA